jgi:acyl-CoA synthetase (AMP-forming)/AMP-acid ligase II
MLMIDFFDRGAERFPDRACLVDDHGTRTYAQVRARSHQIANAFERDNIPPGTKAAVYSGNSAAAFECLIGSVRAGGVWTTVNARNAMSETVYVLNHTDTDLIFFSVEFKDIIPEILSQCPSVKWAICIEQDIEGYTGLETWLEGLPETSVEVDRDLSDLVIMLSSGGTTGQPKGVMVTQAVWEIMTGITHHLLYDDHAINLVVGPMTHAAGGQAMTMMAMGATHIILPGFDGDRVLDAIEQHRVTHVFLPPTAIYVLLARPDIRSRDYSSLKYFIYSAAPMAVDKIKESIEVFGPVMWQGYGQTETGINITVMTSEDHMRFYRAGDDAMLASCGRATLFARVEIMDEEGKILPPDTLGEIVVRTTSVTPGYYKDAEETARSKAFGWHHTGDIGRKDKEGWIFIVDRKKDLVISGGFNIYPSEIEGAILSHPAIQDCAVIGVPDEKWGEALKAVVQLKPGAKFDEEELKEHCRKTLARFKVPKTFDIWPELPRSPAGKVLKRKIREPFWEGKSRAV